MRKFGFSKGLTHDFGQKLENSSEFVSFLKNLDIKFDGVLDKKKKSF